MATAELAQFDAITPLEAPRRLHNGDRLTRREFHKLYEEYPGHLKVELVGGIVYMSSPARVPHGSYQAALTTLLGLYEAETPGVEGAVDASVFLDSENEPQPDLFLRIKEECGGKSWVNSEKYLEGSPELVAEIAYSTRAIDLHAKKENYARAGIQEYIVVCVEPKGVVWFDLKRNRQLPRDAKGIIQSQVFPGLWLDTKALLADDLKKALRTLNRGLATKEHADFVQRLNRRSKRNGAH